MALSDPPAKTGFWTLWRPPLMKHFVRLGTSDQLTVGDEVLGQMGKGARALAGACCGAGFLTLGDDAAITRVIIVEIC